MQEIISKINFLYCKISLSITPVFLVLFSDVKLFYSSVSNLFLPLFILSMLDIATGIWASLKEGQSISSKRFFYNKAIIATLFFICLTAILSLDIFLKNFSDTLPGWLAKSWMTFCAIYEIISLFENANRIRPLPIFSSFLSFFKKNIKEKTGIDIDKDKK